MSENLFEIGHLLLASIFGAGALIICRRAGLDPLNKETAFKAWGIFVGFAVVYAVLQAAILGISS